MVRYLLDANSYIAAKNFHYRMHIVPGFWDWLDTQAENGQVASVEMVRTELLSYGDSLAEWAKHRDSHFLAIDDITTQQCFADIANYVHSVSTYAEPNTAKDGHYWRETMSRLEWSEDEDGNRGQTVPMEWPGESL